VVGTVREGGLLKLGCSLFYLVKIYTWKLAEVSIKLYMYAWFCYFRNQRHSEVRIFKCDRVLLLLALILHGL
jgi:hypothetical protein